MNERMIFDMMSKKIRLALLISGSGTTAEAVIKACQSGYLKEVEPVLVIASKEEAEGLIKAQALGVETKVINPQDFESREAFGQAIIDECEEKGVNFIGQYGWMVLTPENVIEKYADRIINQHPGPLDNGRPDFGGPGMYGMRVHQARILFVRAMNQDFWSEATAHRVTKEFDEGAILKREQVPIYENDTAEDLQARMLPIEHKIQIELLKDFENNKVEEFRREKNLVMDAEVKVLAECKREAIKIYPKG